MRTTCTALILALLVTAGKLEAVNIEFQATTSWETYSSEVKIKPGDASELTLALRLGFYGSINTGTVWFDQVELVPLLSTQGWQRLVDLSKPPAGE